MTPHGLDALLDISRFLTADILPAVPSALASELRAAIKILETAADELNLLYPLLREECEALFELEHESASHCHNTARALPPLTDLRAQLIQLGLDLRGLIALHAQTRARASVQLASLRAQAATDAQARRLEQRYYQLLQRQAARRIVWQSVFDGALGGDAEELTD